jgi:hypothetical protein
MVYLTTLSVDQTMPRRLLVYLMDNELERDAEGSGRI